jgi:hypothetical protein
MGKKMNGKLLEVKFTTFCLEEGRWLDVGKTYVKEEGGKYCKWNSAFILLSEEVGNEAME